MSYNKTQATVSLFVAKPDRKTKRASNGTLRGVKLRKVNLRAAKLRNAKLRKTQSFEMKIPRDAQLRITHVRMTHVRITHVRVTHLRNAQLQQPSTCKQQTRASVELAQASSQLAVGIFESMALIHHHVAPRDALQPVHIRVAHAEFVSGKQHVRGAAPNLRKGCKLLVRVACSCWCCCAAQRNDTRSTAIPCCAIWRHGDCGGQLGSSGVGIINRTSIYNSQLWCK